MSDAWLGFLGGLLAALVGGLIASVVQRYNEEKRRREEAHLSVYILLMELNAHYFWVATAEMNGRPPPVEERTACRQVSWKIAERLRSFDKVEHIDEILEILFSAIIPSANERARKLDLLLENYGKLVNPTYAKHIAYISRANLMTLGMETKTKNNAPGLWQFPSEA